MTSSRFGSSVAGFVVATIACAAAIAAPACGGNVNAQSGDGGGGGTDGGGDTTACTEPPNTNKSPIDKVDVLLMIDNSASMGDKQDFLKLAVPDLVTRLVRPMCIDAGKVVGQSHDDGVCDRGTLEFAPVRDMHIGVVTSALGPRGGDVCNPTEKTSTGLSRHNDDRAHLIDRAGDDEHAIADMQPSNFLSWFPTVPANAGKTPSGGAIPITEVGKLTVEFVDLIAGVHQLGCGIESQLESWYRFLVQPDPYDHIETTGTSMATWAGVDATLLKQRHDFLRPDSALVVIAISDENDSEIDVRSLGGQGYLWMHSSFQPPRGTSPCATNPFDAACTSCKLAPNGGAGDPECAKGPYTAQNDWGFNMNLRHVHMKQKYGIDLQFPMSRYVTGLTSRKVPNRDGEYPAGRANYVGTPSCTNPLFAASLPDGSDTSASTLCNLASGPRTPEMIFYLHIGGVPQRLLHFVPGDPAASALGDGDWRSILGNNPETYDFTGIDPHMIESFAPRPGLPPPSSADNADADNGREWITNAGQGVDRQFACTFALPAPRSCSDPANGDICDCPAASGVPHDQLPPLCDAVDATKQIRAKAYPTIRESLLARKLGAQGLLASICPIHVTEQGVGDPLYGYRPALSSLVDRMAPVLATGHVAPPVCP